MSINTVLVKQFNANIALLSQQKGSKLRNAVYSKTGVVGEDTYLDQLKKSEAKTKTTRNADVEYVNSDFDRRKISLVDKYWADLIDKEDKLKMLADPTSEYVQNAVYALGRAIDDAIITAAFATAYYGKTGTSTVTFEHARDGSTDMGIAAGAAGLTLAKLLDAKKLLDNNDVDEDEPRYIAITGTQLHDLLNTTEVKSADYNTVQALVQGKVDTFCGFKFIIISTGLLDKVASDRYVIAWAQSGLGLAIGADISTNIDRLPVKHYSSQVYASMSIGATRMDEDRVVRILCAE